MEWLQNITLPQSLEHIELLHYLLVISLFIFISFVSIIFWGTGLSVYFKVNEKCNGCRLCVQECRFYFFDEAIDVAWVGYEVIAPAEIHKS